MFQRYLYSILFCCLGVVIFGNPLNIKVKSRAAILMDVNTGAILYEKNAKEVLYPASITKVATALYALDQLDGNLDGSVAATQDCIGAISPKAKKQANYTKPAHWLEFGSTHIGIKRGEILPLKTLMYGLLVSSANDAANVIAMHVSGSVPRFVNELNAYLKSIGCENTYFCNPHGLHHPDHVTTAYDMALITRKALKQEMLCEIVQTVKYPRPQTNKQSPTTLVQGNKLLKRGEYYYPPAFGVKTGYTSEAGYTFIGAAEKDGRRLIAVILGAEKSDDRYDDVIAMFEVAFNEEKKQRNLVVAGDQPFKLKMEGGDSLLKTYTTENEVLEYYPSETPEVKALLSWDVDKLPVLRGEKVGAIEIQVSNEDTPRHVTLYADNDVKMTLWHMLNNSTFLGVSWLKFILIIAVVVVIGGFVAVVKRRH